MKFGEEIEALNKGKKYHENNKRIRMETGRVMTKFYQKKPIVIEAIQLDIPNNDLEVMQFIGALDDKGSAKVDYGKKTLTIPTLEGLMTASNGDFIIKGVNGEFYPCKPDIFDKTYEELKQ